MKPNHLSHRSPSFRGTGRFKKACFATCQKILEQIARTREAIAAEYGQMLRAHEHLVRLALNEAESLAWQTTFPQLVFPTLAAEKMEAVAAWSKHQELVREATPAYRIAA